MLELLLMRKFVLLCLVMNADLKQNDHPHRCRLPQVDHIMNEPLSARQR